ncbi:hypothetical protein EVAR_49935_1 [Eumeta japonica]|uniref:Uncharacterized protein n=1 Tax=Eumeta variegata TaxID=151549 RepID=A0A4C1XV15_EUMVA|nr:hypothetical protein EVAR_49935_1 [Eumeta japonica]
MHKNNYFPEGDSPVITHSPAHGALYQRETASACSRALLPVVYYWDYGYGSFGSKSEAASALKEYTEDVHVVIATGVVQVIWGVRISYKTGSSKRSWVSCDVRAERQSDGTVACHQLSRWRGRPRATK